MKFKLLLKKYKRKAFTLIELLAVIIVLAIVALITTPIILNIIDDAKMSALKSKYYNNLDTFRQYYANNYLSGNISDITFSCENNICYNTNNEDIIELDIEKAFVKLAANGSVSADFMMLDGYLLKENNGELSINKIIDETREDSNLLLKEGTNLFNIKINGNTIQNGTPSLESPIEVKSVGDKTKNLLKPTGNVLGTITPATNVINSGYKWATTTDYIYLEAGTYTISYKEGANLRNVVLFDKDKKYVKHFWSDRANPYTFTLDSNYYVRIDFERNGNVDIDDINTFYQEYEVQLENGSIATSYEPYHNKYKISIELSTKNLFDLSVLNSYYEINGDSVTIKGSNTAAWSSLKYLTLKPNTTYTLSLENSARVDVRNPKSDYLIPLNSNAINKVTFTTDSTGLTCFKLFNVDSNYPYEVGHIQLEEGTDVTSYVPYKEAKTYNIYLDEPLRKIGDTFDSIDLKTGILSRKTGEMILNGSQAISVNSTVVEGYQTYHIMNNSFNIKGNMPVYSSKLPGQELWNTNTKTAQKEQLASASSSLTFRLAESRGIEFSDDGIKSWLSSNPIDITYILQAPRDIPIGLSNIETNGYTNINIKTSTKPSKVEVEYYENE